MHPIKIADCDDSASAMGWQFLNISYEEHFFLIKK